MLCSDFSQSNVILIKIGHFYDFEISYPNDAVIQTASKKSVSIVWGGQNTWLILFQHCNRTQITLNRNSR